VVPDVSSATSQDLKHLGAQVMQNSSDVKALASILAGADGAYFAIDPFTHSARSVQLAAKKIAAAAKEAGVPHVIWSTAEDTCTIIPEHSAWLPVDASRCRVPVLDGRGRSDHYFKEAEVPTTFLVTSFLYEHFFAFETLGFLPRRGQDGKPFTELPIDDKPVPIVAADDLGQFAMQIFQAGQQAFNKYVPACGDVVAGHQIAEVFSTHLGEEVAFRYVSPGDFCKRQPPRSEKLGQLFQYFAEYNQEACKIRSLARARGWVSTQTFHAWFTSGHEHVLDLQRSLKIIAVFGATGAQGGSLIRAVLRDPQRAFAIRAVTRNAHSKMAQSLASLGAEVVECNIDNKEQVKHAMAGAYGAFCISFFWDHFSPDKEQSHARIYAEAAAEAEVKHVIWSTAEDTRSTVPDHDHRIPRLQTNSVVPMFDGKGKGESSFKNLHVPVTFLTPAFYFENLITFEMGPRLQSGEPVFSLPMRTRQLPMIAVEDIGICAYNIFKHPETYLGHHVPACSELLTGQEIAGLLSDELGLAITFKAVDESEYCSSGVIAAKYWYNVLQYCRHYNDRCVHRRNPERSKKVKPDMQTFRTWLQNNRSRLTVLPAVTPELPAEPENVVS